MLEKTFISANAERKPVLKNILQVESEMKREIKALPSSFCAKFKE